MITRIHIKAKSLDALNSFMLGLKTLYDVKENRPPMLFDQEADAVCTAQRKDNDKILIMQTTDGKTIKLPAMPWKEIRMTDTVKIFQASHYDIYTV